MKTNKLLYISVALLWANSVSAQQIAGISEYKYDDASQIWRHTDNAAGLALDSARNRGIAYFDLSHLSGNLHRVQEGSSRNDLTFFTESYQKLSDVFYGYGKFQFDLGETKNRAWSDVQRSYNSNPYFTGSSVVGNYSRQNIDLTAALGTKSFNGWRFGVRLDYNLADLSRLRDPRSRSEMLNYKFTPSATYSFGRNTLGIAGHYNRYKEKIDNITTVQTDATQKYYYMSGLENAQGITQGYKGYQREWVNHNFGAELSYAFSSRYLHSLTSAFIERGSEEVLGQYMYQPGHYYNYIYGFKTQNRIENECLLHEIDFAARYEQGYADEYRQELETTTNPENGLNSYHYNTLLTFKKRYQVNLLNLDFNYRMNFKENKSIKGYIGLKAGLQNTRNKYLLNLSEFKYNSVDWALNGGYGLYNRKLWIEASAGMHNKLKNDLTLADPTTDYAENVLLADRDFYNSNYFTGHLAISHQFPVTIKKTVSNWFVKVYGDYLHSNTHLHNSSVGMAIGIYY